MENWDCMDMPEVRTVISSAPLASATRLNSPKKTKRPIVNSANGMIVRNACTNQRGKWSILEPTELRCHKHADAPNDSDEAMAEDVHAERQA